MMTVPKSLEMDGCLMMDKTHILEDPEGVYRIFRVLERRFRQQAHSL